MKKRLLLTGIGGFIGHHVALWILEHTDWDVVGFDSWNPAHKGDKLRICTKLQMYIRQGRLKLHEVDLAVPFSPETMNVIMEREVEMGHRREKGFNYIINMASDSHVTRSVRDPRTCWKNNTQLIINMLELFREVRCEKFVQISTDEVYGDAGWEGEGHPEWDTIKPSNPYSASKAAQEALSVAYWRTYEAPICITNTMNVIGERQDPEKFLPKVISKIMAGETVSIHSDSEERVASRVWLDAKNVGAALLHILDLPFNRYNQGKGSELPTRYNIVGETEKNVLEMAQLIARIMGRELKYELVRGDEDRPGYDRRYALDGRKLRDTGFQYPFQFEETIERVVKWNLKHPEWRTVWGDTHH